MTPHTYDGDAGDSVFVSMSDLVLSVMFILLILLAFFAGELHSSAMQINALESENEFALGERDQLRFDLRELQSQRFQTDIDAITTEDEPQSTEVIIRDLRQQNEQLSRELMNAFGPTADQVQGYNEAVIAARGQLLRTLQDSMNSGADADVLIQISNQGDALRIVGEGLFASGSATLSPENRVKIERIAETLDEALMCFTLGSRSTYDESCNPAFAIVESLQIEGHTDSAGPSALNLNLGLMRGAETYNTMVKHVPNLTDHLNLSRQPVLSVAGYGEDRPIADNESTAGKDQNRRIDLRFIMRPPRSIDDINTIVDALRDREITNKTQ